MSNTFLTLSQCSDWTEYLPPIKDVVRQHAVIEREQRMNVIPEAFRKPIVVTCSQTVLPTGTGFFMKEMLHQAIVHQIFKLIIRNLLYGQSNDDGTQQNEEDNLHVFPIPHFEYWGASTLALHEITCRNLSKKWQWRAKINNLHYL